MENDVFNGFSYGDNDDWDNEPNENEGNNEVDKVTSNAAIQPVANVSRISELHDPLSNVE